jgi:FKBP-type peptidyl-prolyl cis-trans isomerase/uncharacterized damage-inducible protein DinB
MKALVFFAAATVVYGQGVQLDLEGKGAEARVAFQKAIDEAGTPAAKANAQRAMAMSWAFEGNCKKTGEYEQMVIDYWVTRESAEPHNAFYQEGEMADEAARVCIDAGDLDAAAQWYKKGHDLGQKEPDAPERKVLWDYRWQHAEARIAARRGNRADAEKYVAQARATLGKMTSLKAQQESFFPYLTGYVALYLGDSQKAVADLQKANQNDAFIQCLLGMAYEKLGEKDKAMESYRKAYAVTGHNPPAAFAKPFARTKLAQMPEVAGKVVEAAIYRYVDIQEGTGEAAKPGQEFTVHYTGWLRDGTKFDSSVGKDPLKFIQGRRQVIGGFDVAFEGMKVGAKRRVFIPYQFAYGEKGRGKIPAKAELIFDVELVGVRDVPPAPKPSMELLQPFTELQEKVIALAKAVPAEKYGWRPGPGVRSFQEVFLHIALGNRLMLNIADGVKLDEIQKQIESNTKAEGEALTKEQVIGKLTDSFAMLREALDGENAASLSRDVQFFSTATTRRGVLTFIDTHIAEHMGQAIAYARMNGIVPPWSR